MKEKLPGILLALGIAVPAYWLGLRFPLVGGPVFGILIGMILATCRRPAAVEGGIKFTGKKILQYAIIFLGFEMNLHTVLRVGSHSLSVMVFTLLTAFIVAFFAGRLLKVDGTATLLVGAGTAICGGSAIAAVAPVVEAREKDIAMSISTIFLFNIIAVFVFPFLGHMFHLSDSGFGMWAGTAINDTSSVVAAGYSYSTAAGDYATIVKLTRALMIVPICFLIGAVRVWQVKRQASEETGQVRFMQIMPWFIVWFLVASIVRTFLPMPDALAHTLGMIGKFLIVAAMAAIGLQTHLGHLLKNGTKPIMLGFICWLAVATMSLVVQYSTGLI